ncbi:MAG: glycosyltransferase family 4 protein [Pseudanabaenaceae cyanobacterium bins.68]|nr:glycosyltransferase family 4 protein [Pseudanabaenaceae cyanobacterium bins.68]
MPDSLFDQFRPSDASSSGEKGDSNPGANAIGNLETPGLTRRKLTVITQFYPPDFAATGQLVHELVQALAAEGYQILVYTGMPGYAFNQAEAAGYEYQNHTTIRRTRAAQISPKRIRGKLLNSLFFWLRSLVKLRHSELRGSHFLITSAPPFLGMVGWFYHKLFGHSYTCLVYDIYPDVAVRLGVIGLDHPLVKLWQWINCRVWRRANSLIVLSESMKELLLSQYAKRIPQLASKIFVIHNWADQKLIQPLAKSNNPFAIAHNLVDPFVVQYSGNLGRCHDVDTIIETIYLLRDYPQIRFVFIGSGAGIPLVEQAIATSNLTNVSFLPYQDKQTLPYSLTACDLALVSIKAVAEGVVTPSKVYGILAAGVPIAAICPPNSYLRAMVAAGECGVCIDNGAAQDLADLILNLSQNQQLRDRWGRNARVYLEQNFTLAQILPLYIQAINYHA